MQLCKKQQATSPNLAGIRSGGGGSKAEGKVLTQWIMEGRGEGNTSSSHFLCCLHASILSAWWLAEEEPLLSHSDNPLLLPRAQRFFFPQLLSDGGGRTGVVRMGIIWRGLPSAEEAVRDGIVAEMRNLF